MIGPEPRGGPPRELRPEEMGSLLARTSGAPCHRAQRLLGGRVRDGLSREETELVDRHLAHCRDCASLAETLGWVLPTLEGMAHREPEPAWTDRVLAATSGRAREPALPLGLDQRLQRWWSRAVWRPQLGLQLAYLAAVLVLALTGGRWPPPLLEPVTTLVRAAPAPVRLLPPDPLLARTGEAWDEIRRSGVGRIERISRGIRLRHRSVTRAWSEIDLYGRSWTDPRSLNNLWGDAGRLWRALAHPAAEDRSPTDRSEGG